MKLKILIIIFSVFLPTVLISNNVSATNHNDDEHKIWEENFSKCVEQKNSISLFLSIDTSGSMKDRGEKKGSDENGFRWEAFNALYFQLQKLAKETDTTVQIHASTFSTNIKEDNDVSRWNNLAESDFSLDELREYKEFFNEGERGWTDFIKAAEYANSEFESLNSQKTCNLWVFVTDGEPYIESGKQKEDEIKNAIKPLKNKGTFIYGINLYNPEAEATVREYAISNMKNYLGVSSSSDNKATVVKADNPGELVVLISQIAARSGGNQPLPPETTFICEEGQDNKDGCYFEQVMRPGLKSLQIIITIIDGKNNDDICLEVLTPPEMNIDEKLFCNEFNDKFFNENSISFNWISEYVASLEIIFDEESTDWFNLWRFALRAEEPGERNVTWQAIPDSDLIPSFQPEISLQYGIESCIEVTFNMPTPPPLNKVNFVIKDVLRDEIEVFSETTPRPNRGVKLCITPNEDEIPSEIYILTDIEYEQVEGNIKPAQIADTGLITIKPLPTHPKFECSSKEGEIKVTNPEVFNCKLIGGTNDAEVLVILDTNNSVPAVDWYYKLGDKDFEPYLQTNLIINLKANEEQSIYFRAVPTEAASDLKNTYGLKISSEIIANRDLQKVIYDTDLVLDFKNATLSQKILGLIKYFLFLLLISLIPSIIYARLRNKISYSDSLRGKKMRFKIDGDRIIWNDFKLFSSYNLPSGQTDDYSAYLNYTETDPIVLGKREIKLYGDTIKTQNPLLPLFVKPITSISSNNYLFKESIGFKDKTLDLSSSSINSLWYIKKEDSGLALIIGVDDNENNLEELRSEVKFVIENNINLLTDNLANKKVIKSPQQPDGESPQQPNDEPSQQPDDGPPQQPDDGPPQQPDDGPPQQV